MRLRNAILLAATLTACATLNLPAAEDTGTKPDPALAAQSRALDDRLRTLVAADVLHCAPQELGVAQSNVDFGRLEARRGNDARARQHFEAAQGALARAQKLLASCTARR